MITKTKGCDFMGTHALQHIEVDVPEGITPEYVKEAIVSMMYSQNKLNFKEAREIIGVTRREFEEDILPKYGITVLGDEDIDLEINEILNDQ